MCPRPLRVLLLLGLAVFNGPPALPAAATDDLMTAIRADDTQAVMRCIDTDGHAATTARAAGGVSPLHLAAALNRMGVMDLLFAHGASVSNLTDGGFSPLHWAASMDAAGAARLLLLHGADAGAATSAGVTPLHWAAGQNATNVIRLLLEDGASPAARTASGRTPLHWAVMQHADEAALLLAEQAIADGSNAMDVATLTPAAAIQRASHDLRDARIDPLPQPELPPEIRPPAAAGTSAETSAVPPLVILAPQGAAPRSGAPAPGAGMDVHLAPGEALTFVYLPTLGAWFGRTEVPNWAFRRFRPTHDSLFRESLSLRETNQPVVNVSWNEAVAFCDWMNACHGEERPAGLVFRLPTSEEWKTAARCGDDRIYPWGSEWPPSGGNFADATAVRALPGLHAIGGYDDGAAVACPVADAGTNAWGLAGMAGNVWEWCADWYDPETRQYKVRYGGGWDDAVPEVLRLDTRGFDRPDVRDDTIGFRVILGPPLVHR